MPVIAPWFPKALELVSERKKNVLSPKPGVLQWFQDFCQGTQGAFRCHNDLPIFTNLKDFIAINETSDSCHGFPAISCNLMQLRSPYWGYGHRWTSCLVKHRTHCKQLYRSSIHPSIHPSINQSINQSISIYEQKEGTTLFMFKNLPLFVKIGGQIFAYIAAEVPWLHQTLMWPHGLWYQWQQLLAHCHHYRAWAIPGKLHNRAVHNDYQNNNGS